MMVQAVSVLEMENSEQVQHMCKVPSRYSCQPAISVVFVGIMKVCPKELHFIDQGLHFAGMIMALEGHRSRYCQPRLDRVFRWRMMVESEDMLMWSLVGCSTEKTP